MENDDKNIALLCNKEEQQSFIQENQTEVQIEPLHIPHRRLLPGKKFHLFVSCSREDNSYSKELVKNLEKKNVHMLCMQHERDFLPGTRILRNIADSIEECEKFLVVLSPTFLKRGYCLEEMAQARDYYVRNNMEGHMICLKRSPCEIPKELRHITYIDGCELSALEVADKVQRAFEKNESYKQRLTNGMELVKGKMQKKRKSNYVGSRYVFTDNPLLYRPYSNIEDSNVKRPDEIALGVYEDAKEHMNSFWWMRILGSIWSTHVLFLLSPCGGLSFGFLLLIVIGLIERDLTVTVLRVLSVLFAPFVSSFIILPITWMILMKMAYMSIRKESNKYLRGGISKGTKYFVIFRSNFSCNEKQFLEEQMMNEIKPELTADDIKKKIDNYLCDAIAKFDTNKSFQENSDTQYRRHPTYKDVPCLCQRVEQSKEYKAYLSETRKEKVDMKNPC